MPDDIAAAARRVADLARDFAARPQKYDDDGALSALLALLPVLDAAAAGRGDGARVERTAASPGPIPPAAMAVAVEAWGEAWAANEAGSLAEFGRAYADARGTNNA